MIYPGIPRWFTHDGYTLQWFGYFPYCFLIIYHPIWEMNGTVCDPRRSRNMQTVFLWVEETTKWWACLTSLYRICQICEYIYIYTDIYIYCTFKVPWNGSILSDLRDSSGFFIPQVTTMTHGRRIFKRATAESDELDQLRREKRQQR
jgi:hypothetical protein